MKDNGKKIIWKVWVYINGTMGDHIKANIWMIKNMVTAYIGGQMVVSILAIGTQESNMV